MEISSIKLTKSEKIKIANTDDIHRILVEVLRREGKINQEKEHFWFIGLNAHDYILCIDTISLGSIEAVEVNPMNVFRNGVWKGARYAILAHNHPSGNLKPSRHDIEITDRLYQCGAILNIPITDHVIISMKTYLSFQISGIISKIKKSIKYVPPYLLKDRWAREAGEIREKAKEDGIKEGILIGKKEGKAEGILLGKEEGILIGESKGIAKGQYLKSIHIAKKMKDKNIAIKDIMHITGLKKKEIDKM